ncbi:MAG: replicative DNA helicase [Mycoplasma sp.]
MDLIKNDPVSAPLYEIERTILSIMLNDNSTIANVVAILEPKDFSDSTNRAIFAAILEYYLLNNKCDPKLFVKYIEANDKFIIPYAPTTILNLLNIYTDSFDLEMYIDTIKMNSTLVQLKRFGNDLQDLTLEYNDYNDEIWDLQKKFLDIVNSRTTGNILDTKQVTRQFLEKLEQIKTNKGVLNGTTSGFVEVDEFTNGFQPGDLIILAARPSIGKTALAINMLLSAAKDCTDEECVVFFSLEMGSQQIMERLVSRESNINSNVFKRGTWTPHQEGIINSTVSKINLLPILIDESSNNSILEIQTKLKQIASTKKIKMIVVDYLQLVQGSQKFGTNRQQEVSQISRTLKSIARDVESPLIAIAQLSRKIEERKGPDKKPILSDLRESGSIEQDADMVVFLNYDRDELDTAESTETMNKYKKIVIVDFIVAKNRNGATGEIKLVFEKEYGRYSNYNSNN